MPPSTSPAVSRLSPSHPLHPTPTPPPTSHPLTSTPLADFEPKSFPVHWYTSSADPLRRRDSPLHDLFPEKAGFVETGPPARRDDEAVAWLTPPHASDEQDYDPLRRRDSPLRNLPHEGSVGGGGPGPRVGDARAW